MSDLRSPLAKARDAWLESKEGKLCCDGLAEGKYLENRLVLAFLAGAKWNASDPAIPCCTRCGCVLRNPHVNGMCGLCADDVLNGK